MPSVKLLGWREWLALPELGVPALRGKLDTGARSCSLHVDALEPFRRQGGDWLRFVVRGHGHRSTPQWCQVRASDRRRVTDAGGHASMRWFIRSALVLAGECFEVELNLADRGAMRYAMLIGRSALQGRFAVDPGRSYVSGPLVPTRISLP